MATYQDIKGLRVKYLSADPSRNGGGEVWYNSTTGTLKGVVKSEAFPLVELLTARGWCCIWRRQTAALLVEVYSVTS